MLNSILYDSLLKIYKENQENNYIYSDIKFSRKLIEQKAKKEKQKLLLSGRAFHFDKLRLLQKSKTTRMKETKEIFKKIKNNKNKGNKSNIIKKINIIPKTDLNTISILPKVNNDKKNIIQKQDLSGNFGKNNFNIDKIKNFILTQRRQKSCLMDESDMKKSSEIKNVSNNNDSNSTLNFHVLKINSPSEPIQKSISSTIFNLQNLQYSFFKKRFQKIIRLNNNNNKTMLSKSNENEKNYKRLLKKIKIKKNSEVIKNEELNILNYNKIEKISLSSSLPKYNFNFNIRHKLYPMIQINNFIEKYVSLNDINNPLIKSRNESETKLPLYKNVFEYNNNDIYYYAVNKMYANQIREYMKHRINWEFISDKNLDKNITINFSWRYFSNRVNYKKYQYNPELINTNSYNVKKLRMINLFERNNEVGNKKYMFLNLINYCDKKSINVFSIVPFTIILNNTPEVEFALDALRDIILFVNKNKSYDEDLISNRKYNDHFWFDKNFENINKQYININKNFLSEKNYWIVKPTDLYQGKCIEIFSDFNQINKQCKTIFRGINTRILPENNTKEEEENNYSLTNNNDNDNSPKKKSFYSKMYCSNEIIIQKYLDRPLLYNNRKFDIRCFVLIDYNLNLFFFREGHLKASSELYTLNDRNRFIHITNYSLQKKCSKFETYEEGNEISYNDFKKFLESQNIPLINFDNMISEMKVLVEISMKSVGKKLLKTEPVLSFEIFGYDFIIDNEFKPWILEINNNPGLAISSPVIEKIIPRMLDDAFRLTIDKIFETKYDLSCRNEEWKYKSKYKIDGISDDDNGFEFLCNIK